MAAKNSDELWLSDPFQFIDNTFSSGGTSAWFPEKQLCIADGKVAREVLANKYGLFEEHSDFFYTSHGIFGTRSVQEKIGRDVRVFLTSYLDQERPKLASSVIQSFVPFSDWPDAGNWLIYHHLANALLTPDTQPKLRNLVEDVVRRAVLSGARDNYSKMTRTAFRFRFNREMAREIKKRRKNTISSPRDILDIIIAATNKKARLGDLAEIFLSFLFAMAGSVGFTLGWSLLLLGTHAKTDAKPAWIVREALRLWPIAWNLSRRPAKAHELDGVKITPNNTVIVCPYAVHRNPQNWDAPNTFRPQRWRGKKDNKMFMPFGWGAHSCVASVISMGLVESILIILKDYAFRAESVEQRPLAAAALAPPPFKLYLSLT